MPFSLVTCRSGGEKQLGVRRANGAVLAPPQLKRWRHMLDLLEDWTRAEEVLATMSLANAPVIDPCELLTPVAWPRKVLCAGVNYWCHIREMGGEAPGEGWRPYFFLKPPSTSVIGPADPIVIRGGAQARYDWEAELAVVIGAGGRDIDVRAALRHVAGYCVANDVTARGYHRRTTVPDAAFTYDWFAAKATDTSLPLGPGITPAFTVADPQDLRMRLWVNDQLKQDQSTGDMICRIDQLVAAASAVVTLEPGDVICTGTPSGVGAGSGRYLQHGDVVRVAIDGLGEITNRVIDAERTQR
jgi:2-keto-4-pentenoate hydratase/2-oxohepta-3-ene-1,7-dioic acid hydratase in catechol pathway